MLFLARALFGSRAWIAGVIVALVLGAFAAYRIHNSGHLQMGTLMIVGIGFVALVAGLLRRSDGR